MVVEAKNGMGYVKKKFDEPNLRIQGGQVTSIGKDITTFPFKMWGKEPQNSITSITPIIPNTTIFYALWANRPCRGWYEKLFTVLLFSYRGNSLKTNLYDYSL